MNVSDWIKRLNPEQLEILDAVSTRVTNVVPGSEMSIKWGHPIWSNEGAFALVKPASRHLSLGFWNASELTDPDGLLEGTGASVRHVKLEVAGDLEKFPVDIWLKEAAAASSAENDK